MVRSSRSLVSTQRTRETKQRKRGEIKRPRALMFATTHNVLLPYNKIKMPFFSKNFGGQQADDM